MRNTESLRVHHLLPASRSNGPGLRAVIWLQGCTLGCPGCFNPDTHAAAGGQVMAAADLAAWAQDCAAAEGVEGVTISGGEPLQQAHPLRALLEQLRAQTNLSVVLFSGLNRDEIQRSPALARTAGLADVLLAGRYQADRRLAAGLRGSANKSVHFLSGRYSPADLEDVPAAEVFIAPDGSLTLSGIDPLTWDAVPGARPHAA